ncbi:flagellar protein FlaG [Deefgea sp. CFH1-16]|uniref:flagellar protein FlaG n=1 Tax=Deefgea sp. CFH1-16 TaxID=2675457 RepID=UPI0015F3EF5C|nr:flagellar protein FlaG [Deefgea sp. CFH1-16]MBM5575411.1 hypothetical protein [Deefgea sp. CFH1-16]
MQISNLNQVSSAPSPTNRPSSSTAAEVQNTPAVTLSQPLSDVQTVQAVKAAEPDSEAKSLEDSVKKMNDAIQSMQRDVGLEFSIDDSTNIKMVKVMDIDSKEVIRMIPGPVVIDIAKAIDKFQGLLIRDKA